MMIVPLFALVLLLDPAQQATPRAGETAPPSADAVRRVEDLLESGKFTDAEPLLQQLATANPHDERILFDLGFTQEHNGQEDAAASSYAAAIAADPKIAEPHLALGLLSARRGKADEARRELESVASLATANPASKARALRALARLDQPTQPARSRDELAEAIRLTGEQPGDAEFTGSLASAAGDTPDAEAALRRELARSPDNLTAITELGSLLQRDGKFAAAEALLAPALSAHPDDPRLAAQTAVLYANEDRPADALRLLERLRNAHPESAQDPGLTRLYAHLLLVTGDPARAEPLYRQLVAANAKDSALLDELGSVLVREQKFPEAQTVLVDAVGQRTGFVSDVAWGDAAGHLAFAASRNHQPQMVLQALQARATVLPNSPSTLFLEATAHDSLRQKKEAERAYRAFLAAAKGKLPDEEFEARHRLTALEHEH